MHRSVCTSAIGYCRVSTGEQGDSGLGLAAQRDAIGGECSRRGWSLLNVATDVASGKSTRGRTALAEALRSLDRGEGNVLIVAKLDRLARSVLDFSTIMQRADHHGWAVVALDANVDTTSAQGALMTHVLAAFAEYERKLIADRTRAALAAKRAQGWRAGRPVQLQEGTRQRVTALRASGMTLRGIADLLNAEGTPTAGGGLWYPATVRQTLQSVALDRQAVETTASVFA